MSDPRDLDVDVDKVTRDLFDAAKDEPVPIDAKTRALDRLGLSEGGAGGSGNASGSGSGSGSGSMLLKGGAAAIVVGAALYFALRGDPAPSRATPVEPALTTGMGTGTAHVPNRAPPEDTSTPAAPHAPLGPSAEVAPTASASAPASAAAPARTPVASARPSSDNLAAELASLDRARRAVRSGDMPGALGELDDYAKKFPAGALRNEALVVRVEALMKAGRAAEAQRASAPFLKAHPDEVASRRIRALLEAK